jgi:hypothetical protein
MESGDEWYRSRGERTGNGWYGEFVSVGEMK